MLVTPTPAKSAENVHRIFKSETGRRESPCSQISEYLQIFFFTCHNLSFLPFFHLTTNFLVFLINFFFFLWFLILILMVIISLELKTDRNIFSKMWNQHHVFTLWGLEHHQHRILNLKYIFYLWALKFGSQTLFVISFLNTHNTKYIFKTFSKQISSRLFKTRIII